MSADLRYELKLVCYRQWLAQARSWIRLHPAGFVTAYPPRWVNNIYFDTPRLDSLNANLAGISRRQKLRLRWYGRADLCRAPWLELKLKNNLLGDKKRASGPALIDLRRPWTEIMGELQKHILPSWPTWVQGCLRPTLYNRYRREYYVTPDKAIRITCDFDQYACDQRFSRRPNLRGQLPLMDQVVIEIKAGPDQQARLQEIVGSFPLPRSRNSKYVNGLWAALIAQ